MGSVPISDFEFRIYSGGCIEFSKSAFRNSKSEIGTALLLITSLDAITITVYLRSTFLT